MLETRYSGKLATTPSRCAEQGPSPRGLFGGFGRPVRSALGVVLCAVTVCVSCGGRSFAASLEHGHVRANTRAFVHKPQSEWAAGTVGETGSDAPHGEQAAPASHGADVASASSQPSPSSTATSSGSVAPRVRGFGKSMRFWREEETPAVIKREGYLASGPPNPLRFSDDSQVNRRPPSPALPEFSVTSRDYAPYLIEEPLPEDALNDPSVLSEIVIELEPHSVLSGVIETKRKEAEPPVETFELEERQAAVLRPEEVLIYFEADGQTNRANAIIPFAPAQPSAETIESSAKFRQK